jgi:hypothetical protein
MTTAFGMGPYMCHMLGYFARAEPGPSFLASALSAANKQPARCRDLGLDTRESHAQHVSMLSSQQQGWPSFRPDDTLGLGMVDINQKVE